VARNDDDKPTKSRLFMLGFVMLLVISIVAVSTSVVLYNKYKKTQDSGRAQAQQLVTQLSKVLDLPKVTPAVVTVTDKTKLGNQALAARVANQDTLLIYGAAKRIIIYRPSTKKVIDMLSFDKQAEVSGTQSQIGQTSK
jgi:alpha-N-acetylglucosamine transferase